MSYDAGYREYGDGRFDSVWSLPLNQGQSTQTSTTQHEISSTLPWSSYNIRQDSLIDSVHEISSPDPYTVGRGQSAYLFDSDLRKTITRTPSPLSIPSTLEDTTSAVVSCDQCGIEFTGRWQVGNRARHVRHKHKEVDGASYTCQVDGCLRSFQRQDARLKHERKKHPELHRPTERPRPRTEPRPRVDPSNEDTPSLKSQSCQDHAHPLAQSLLTGYDNKKTVSTYPQHDPTSGLVVSLSPAAWRTFNKLRATLDADQWACRCDLLFSRWTTIAQNLKLRSSPAHRPFARALADIYHVVEAIECDTIDTGHPSHHSESTQGAAHRDYGALTKWDTSASSSAAQSLSRQASSQHQRGRSNPVTVATRGNDVAGHQIRQLDCFVHRRFSMYRNSGEYTLCHGCSKENMSQVRKHVRDCHVGDPASLEMFKRCPTCGEAFINMQAFEAHGFCRNHVPDFRRNPTIAWVRGYLTMYPDDVDVPTPFNGEDDWVSPEIVEYCRNLSRSFLGQTLRTPAILAPVPSEGAAISDLSIHNATEDLHAASEAAPDEDADSSDQPAYNIALNFMLRDASGISPSQELEAPETVIPRNSSSESPRVAFMTRLEHARSHYISLLEEAPLSLPLTDLKAEAECLSKLASSISHIADAHGSASWAYDTQTVYTHPSTQGVDNVFAESSVSYETDPTTAPDMYPGGLYGYGQPSFYGGPSQYPAAIPCMNQCEQDFAYVGAQMKDDTMKESVDI